MNLIEKSNQIDHWLKTNDQMQAIVSNYMMKTHPQPVSVFDKNSHFTVPNGFEGILTQDGLWYPLKGSHSLMLNYLAAQQLHASVSSYIKSLPAVCYTSMSAYALRITNVIEIRSDVQHGAMQEPNRLQQAALQRLDRLGLIHYHYEQIQLPARLKVQFNKLLERQESVLAAS